MNGKLHFIIYLLMDGWYFREFKPSNNNTTLVLFVFLISLLTKGTGTELKRKTAHK